MEWSSLLVKDRLDEKVVINEYVENEHFRCEFDKDYSRILTCIKNYPV